MPHDKDLTHWHEPSGNKKAGFGTFKKQPTPYDAFMESEGVPVFRDVGISKVQNLPLFPWKRTGGKGHYIQLLGTETKWGCFVVEVPPAGALARSEAYVRRDLSGGRGPWHAPRSGKRATPRSMSSSGKRVRCFRSP